MTAVEYLFNELWESPKDKLTWHSILTKAKEMEKQQIIDAHKNGEYLISNIENAELYYTSTYGSKGSDATFPKTEPAMIIPEAISILKIHQKWRLGADIVMIEPKELTEALDLLINYHTDIMNETLS